MVIIEKNRPRHNLPNEYFLKKRTIVLISNCISVNKPINKIIYKNYHKINYILIFKF